MQKEIKESKMTPNDIFKKFKKVFPVTDEEIDRISVIDTNVLKVRLKNRKELVFTYFSSNKWRIDSLDLYLRDKKK